MLKIKRLDEYACLPIRANPTDAGADLIAPYDLVIKPMSSEKVHLGFAMELPVGTVGLIYARSSLGTKFGVRPRNCVGVIDEKYRGEVIVVLENSSCVPYVIKEGDRIAQLVISPVFTPEIVEVDELDMTEDRGGGFGSTGK